MKRNTAKHVSRLLIAITAALIILFCYWMLHDIGLAEDYDEDLVQVWVLCQPDSYVNVREFPSSRSHLAGYAESGYSFYTDGTKRNGFLLITGSFEAGEGWIHAGYIVYSEPKEVNEKCWIDSNGRVAARRTIGGNRRCWLRSEDEIIVFWISDEWSVTNKGFVKTEFLGGV